MGRKRRQQLRFGQGFRVLFGNDRSQAASMKLAPGDSEADSDNRHEGADQWLYVVSGVGRAIVGKKAIELREGVVVLIERGQTNPIENTGPRPLKTLSIYVPLAYISTGDELPAGRAS